MTGSESVVRYCLDTPAFFLHEHNLKINGKWFNYRTCIKDFDTCPICEDGSNSSYIVVGTIINHKGYTDKEGNEYKHQKMLFVGKSAARERILKQIEKRDGDLKYCAYEAERGTKSTECSTGQRKAA